MNLLNTIYMYFRVFIPGFVLGSLLISCSGNKDIIDLSTLFDEMASAEEAARYPAIPYRSFALSGRAENVLFDQQGPGVITRIRLAAEDKRGIVRFYLDNSSVEEITLSAYDLSQLNLPEAEGGLLTAGGSVSYLPIPYAKRCRITFEEAPDADPAPKYYQINYRRYPAGTPVETFSLQKLQHIKRQVAEVNHRLQNPDLTTKAGEVIRGEVLLEGGSPFIIRLPQGEHAVYRIRLQVGMPAGTADYAQQMRNVVLQGIFDGKLTLRAPVSDFSGGGIGAPYVESFYLSSDGKGDIVSRWLMPYREKASLSLVNEGKEKLSLRYEVCVSPLPWDERSLYFHASWKEELGLQMGNPDKSDWDLAAIRGGRGVYKGDVLTLYNHTSSWYGGGEMGIYVDDDDTVPSHSEDKTDDYYNLQRPATVFHTPFGGAPRTGRKDSYGYNTLFRTRILDGIPFTNRLRANMQLPGEKAGTIDCATTLFWYGDRKARPEKTSRPEVWARTLSPSPAGE
jgi:hypothetical protein